MDKLTPKTTKRGASILTMLGLTLFAIAALPEIVSGASLTLSPASAGEARLGREFAIKVLIDAQGEVLNAIQGKIYFPGKELELKSVNEGGSIVSLWIDRPQLIRENGRTAVSFSGVIPGGFRGMLGSYAGVKPGEIFSLSFLPKATGKYSLEPKEIVFLLNDGRGTPTLVETTPLEFEVGDADSAAEPATETRSSIPEEFHPAIASDPDTFDGRYFLVFSAADKKTGIDHYEVMETRRNDPASGIWKRAESPYVLEDQGMTSYIFVKTVNKSGNERLARVPPPRSGNAASAILSALGVILIGVWAIISARQRRKKIK